MVEVIRWYQIWLIEFVLDVSWVMLTKLLGVYCVGVDNGEFICEDCEGTARNIMFVLEGLKISAQTIGVTAEAVDREILYLLRGLGVED